MHHGHLIECGNAQKLKSDDLIPLGLASCLSIAVGARQKRGESTSRAGKGFVKLSIYWSEEEREHGEMAERSNALS